MSMDKILGFAAGEEGVQCSLIAGRRPPAAGNPASASTTRPWVSSRSRW